MRVSRYQLPYCMGDLFSQREKSQGLQLSEKSCRFPKWRSSAWATVNNTAVRRGVSRTEKWKQLTLCKKTEEDRQTDTWIIRGEMARMKNDKLRRKIWMEPQRNLIVPHLSYQSYILIKRTSLSLSPLSTLNSLSNPDWASTQLSPRWMNS